MALRAEIRRWRERGGDPLMNYLQDDAEWAVFSAFLRAMSGNREEGWSAKEQIMRRLGRQSYCDTYGVRRYWVWERPTYRIVWAKEKGWSVEVFLDPETRKPSPPVLETMFLVMDEVMR